MSVNTSSKEESDAINYVLNTRKAWIGVNDIAKEGNFVTAEYGLPVKYTNWDPNQPPKSYDTDQNCVFVKINGLWNDYSCGFRTNIICSYDANCEEPEAHFLCFASDSH
ncbi:low affinity immunoglobulin epsilon Fc receptor-like [Oratosquilla oratoria]|uniref:low affinity immunoglobulin epsilon Fc receptor-like n=1 Tax=Oratosquilla oratoria TaxID=337810 RepID=UPI003F75F8E3